MTSLLTNASAQTAIRTLRSVQNDLQETQDRISTGLKVRSPKENPAFFLVSQTVKGDVAVLDGLKDNLTIGVSAARTANSGLNGITEDINQIQSALTTAQTGTALNEVQFAIDQVIAQIEGQIDSTSFNGVNLLAGQDTTTVTTTITRDNGSFELSTFTLQAQNLDSLEFAGVETGIFTGANASANAETAFNNLYRAFNSGMADRLDANGDGAVDLSPTGLDDQLTLDGIARPSDAATFGAGSSYFSFYGNAEDRAFFESVGLETMSLGNIGADTNKEVIAIRLDEFSGGVDVVADGSNGIAMNYTNAKTDTANAFAATPSAGFPNVATYLQETVFSDGQLRAFANDSGFRAVARQIEVADPANGNVQAGFVIADTLISRVNISATVVGVFESTLTSRQNFLSDLTDSLELGVASLIEADLNEESSRLQSIQVQEQLAVQALGIANQRPQSILSLFQ